jgi:hypothetical protein
MAILGRGGIERSCRLKTVNPQVGGLQIEIPWKLNTAEPLVGLEGIEAECQAALPRIRVKVYQHNHSARSQGRWDRKNNERYGPIQYEEAKYHRPILIKQGENSGQIMFLDPDTMNPNYLGTPKELMKKSGIFPVNVWSVRIPYDQIVKWALNGKLPHCIKESIKEGLKLGANKAMQDMDIRSYGKGGFADGIETPSIHGIKLLGAPNDDQTGREPHLFDPDVSLSHIVGAKIRDVVSFQLVDRSTK